MKLRFNKKLYFKLVLSIVGAFLMLDLGFIVTFNMLKDSALTGKSQEIISNGGQQEPNTQGQETENQDEQTQDPGKQDEPGNDANSKEKIKIELINYTGDEDIGRQVRATLEANSYQVVLSNGRSNQPVQTSIIERHDRGAGLEIQKLLGMGTIIKAFDEGSEFDVRLEIGHDYLP